MRPVKNWKIDMLMLYFLDIFVFNFVICRGHDYVIHVQSNSSSLIILYISVQMKYFNHWLNSIVI